METSVHGLAKRRRRCSFVSLVFIGLSLSSAVAADDAAKQEFLKTNSLFNRELYDLAIPRYLKILEQHKDFAQRSEVEYALALSYDALASRKTDPKDAAERKRLLDGSVTYAKSAIKDRKLKSRRAAFRLLARNLLATGQPAASAKVYQALYDKSKGLEHADAALGLADAKYEAKKYVEAAKYYQEARASFRATPKADTVTQTSLERSTFHLALSWYQLDGEANWKSSLPLFEEVAGGDGSLANDGAYMAALTHQKLGDSEAALKLFRRLQEEANQYREAGLYGEGSLLFESGDYAASKKVLETLVRDFPMGEYTELGNLYLGRALLHEGQLRTGGRILNNLRRSATVGAEASLWLARAYATKGAHSQATKILAAAVKKFATSEQIEGLELELCIEYVADESFDEADRALAVFASKFTESKSLDHIAYLRCYVLHQKKNHSLAVKAAERFIETHKTSRFRSEVIQLAAESLFLDGEYERAEAFYKQYLEVDGSGGSVLIRYRLAEAAALRGQHAQALASLKEIQSKNSAELDDLIESDPAFASFDYFVGDVNYALGQHDDAVTSFKTYLGRTTKPLANDARFKLGHALQLSGKRDQAKAAYESAIEADAKTPHALQIRFELGQIAMESEDLDSAASAFRAVIESDSEGRFSPFCYHFLGWIASQSGDHAAAVGWYSTLVRKYPDHDLNAEGLYLLALSLQADSKFEQARGVLKSLEQKHPNAGVAEKIRLQEAISLSRQGKAAEARDLFQSLRKLKLDAELSSLLLYELAWCHRELEDIDSAVESYRALLDRKDADGNLVESARLELAELEFDRGDVKASQALLEELVGESSGVRETALYRLSWCHYKTGDLTRLQKSFDTLATSFPSSERRVEVATLLAKSLVTQREFEKAGELFKTIADSAKGGEGGVAIVSYGECLNEQRRFAETKTALQNFERDHPKSPYQARAQFALGWAHENTKDRAKALEHYKKALGTGSVIAARAQFQMGQCHAADKKYQDAIVEFLQVPSQFSYPEWSSRALLQIAGCFEAIDELDRAKKYYDEVIAKYPDRDEAKLAKKRLESNF